MSDSNLGADGSPRMIDVTRSSTVAAIPEAVWEAIGDFSAISDWHPAVSACRLDDRDGTSVRRLTLVGGATLVEEMVRRDDAGRSYTYRIVEGPLPVGNYVSTIAVFDDGTGGSRIDWTGRFEAVGASEDEATGVVAGIYEAGLDALVAKVGG